MRGQSFALAAVLLISAAGAAFGQPPASANGAALSTQTMGNPLNTRNLDAYTPHNQNPLVNPSAAGTQMGWTGYDRTSGATQVTQPNISLRTVREARLRLVELGYHRITYVHRTANGGWLARAQWGDRPVWVRLNRSGIVVAQR